MTNIFTKDFYNDINQMSAVIKEQLQKGIVNITFKKKDGTTRVLKGTTKTELLPKVEPSEDGSVKPVRKQSDDVIVCFDTEKQEWRSFRKDSVIEFQYDN